MVSKVLTHYLVIIVLLLSQWFTVTAMACPLNESSSAMSMNMTANDDVMPCHDMSNTNYQSTGITNNDMDCCDNNCHCPTGASFSLLLVNMQTTSAAKVSNDLLDDYQFSSLTSSLKQHAKPPQYR
jgi:ubiquitin